MAKHTVSRLKKAQLNSQANQIQPKPEEDENLDPNSKKYKAKQIRYRRQARRKISRFFLLVLLVIAALAGAYIFLIYPRQYGDIMIYKLGDGQEYASFEKLHGWVSSPGDPSGEGSNIELFPTRREHNKAMVELKDTKADKSFPKFRAILGQKATHLSTAEKFFQPSSLKTFKENSVKVPHFQKWLNPRLANIKQIICDQYHKGDLYNVGCYFQSSDEQFYNLNLYTNQKYYNYDLKNYYHVISTLQGDFSAAQ